jgi:hypothetical protein
MCKLLLLLLTFVFAALTVQATPPEDPLYLFSQRMLAGDTAWAREAFRRELEQRLDFLASDPKGPRGNLRPIDALIYLGSAADVLKVWQESEFRLARKAASIPPEQRSELFRYSQRIEEALEPIEEAEKLSRSKESSKALEQFALYRRGILDTILKSLALSRDSASTEKRAQLWSKVRPRLGRTEDLRIFDKETDDLTKVLKIDAAPSSQLHAQPQPPEYREIRREEEPQLFAVLERLYRAAFDGDRTTVESLATPSAVTHELITTLAELKGGRFERLGRVLVKDLGNGRITVRVVDGSAAAGDGRKISLNSIFVVHRTASGSYIFEQF